MEVGERLEVKMRANPSTGYTWMVVQRDLEENNLGTVLQVAENIYIPDPHESGFVGGGGVYIIKFNIINKGSGVLNLYYARPWILNQKILAN